MLKETMDNFELETEIHLRAEGIEAMIAMLDLGINGDGESLPTKEAVRSYLRHLEREVAILRRDIRKVKMT